MNPYLRWAVLLLVAGGLAYYYQKGTVKSKLHAIKPSLEKTESAISTKKIKQRKPKAKAPEVRNGRGSPTPTPKPQPQAQVTPSHDDGGEGMSNLEFAKQFSKTREGNAISAGGSKKDAPSSKPAPKPTPKAASRPVTGGSTSASSMTGAEADDDMSLGESPVVKPAGDVSDMLEAPAPGASVLRLTGSVENEKKGNKNKKSDGYKTAETKKQRQQRLKRENNKLMVQEAESQRRALLEKQLHTAREHERQEAAKSKPPTSNAWATNGATNGIQKPVSAAVPLLDTFDSKSKAIAPEKENKAGPLGKNWVEGLPSEEDQMRLLLSPAHNNEESEWTTVPSAKNKSKRRTNNTGAAMSDTSSSETQAVKPAPAPAPAPVRQSKPFVQEGVWKEQSHPLDSDWAA